MDSLIHLARQEGAYLSAIRRELHRHPELALREYRTASVIERELDAAGIPHTRVGETSVLGTLEGSGTGPAIALRADIDALPIQEETGAEYRSERDGVMHACGHDVHAPACWGRQNCWPGTGTLFQARYACCSRARRKPAVVPWTLLTPGFYPARSGSLGCMWPPTCPRGPWASSLA